MSDGVEENGGGVMLVFSSDPEKRDDVLDALQYIARALTAHQLLVTEHKADPLSKDHRCVSVFLDAAVCKRSAGRDTQILRLFPDARS